MSPTLNDGDIVLTKTPRSLRPGRLYIVQHSDLGRIVKRLDAEIEGRYNFIGDNPASTPSAIIAPVEASRITGEVIAAFGRSGLRFRFSI